MSSPRVKSTVQRCEDLERYNKHQSDMSKDSYKKRNGVDNVKDSETNEYKHDRNGQSIEENKVI